MGSETYMLKKKNGWGVSIYTYTVLHKEKIICFSCASFFTLKCIEQYFLDCAKPLVIIHPIYMTDLPIIFCCVNIACRIGNISLCYVWKNIVVHMTHFLFYTQKLVHTFLGIGNIENTDSRKRLSGPSSQQLYCFFFNLFDWVWLSWKCLN